MTGKKIFSEIQTYALLTFATCLSSLGWGGFIIPSGIIGGGVTGMSTSINFLTGWDIGIISLSINAVLIVLAIWILGMSYGIKSIYCIVLFSFMLSLMGHWFPEPIIKGENNKLIAILVGATAGGTGSALMLLNGGSTGGSEIIALIIAKYRNVRLARILLLIDVVIISSSFFVLKGNDIPEKITTVMYGLLTMVVFAYVVDIVMNGTQQSVQITIISNKYEELSEKITTVGNKGLTIVDGIGGYTKEERKILMVVSRKRTSSILLKLIKDIDPEAFVTMGNVANVFGQGFDQIKS